MSQQGKRKTKNFAGLLYITKNRKISCVLYAHSQFLRSLARFDLENVDVHQAVQLDGTSRASGTNKNQLISFPVIELTDKK